VAGNFLYVACVSMFPLLVKEQGKLMNLGIFVGFWFGVVVMYSITFGEAEDEHVEEQMNN
jgi:hypothetical protein